MFGPMSPTVPNNGRTEMTNNIQYLEAHLDTLARFIDEREDGERYVPLYERVEEELAKLRRSRSTYDRIRARRAATAGGGSINDSVAYLVRKGEPTTT